MPNIQAAPAQIHSYPSRKNKHLEAINVFRIPGSAINFLNFCDTLFPQERMITKHILIGLSAYPIIDTATRSIVGYGSVAHQYSILSTITRHSTELIAMENNRITFL